MGSMIVNDKVAPNDSPAVHQGPSGAWSQQCQWLRKVANHTWVRWGHSSGPGHRLQKGSFSPQGRDARFGKNNTGRPVIFAFQLTDNFLVYLRHPCTKILYIYLKFKFNWESCIFSGNPTPGTQHFFSFPEYLHISRFKLHLEEAVSSLSFLNLILSLQCPAQMPDFCEDVSPKSTSPFSLSSCPRAFLFVFNIFTGV